MLKVVLSALVFLCTGTLIAQNDFEKSLDSIQTLDDANQYVASHKTVKGKVIVFNEEKHKTRMAQDILGMGVGAKKYFKDSPQKTYYKVLEKSNVPFYRLSYVFLDGNKKSKEEIQNLVSMIREKYHQGYRFEDLAKLYSMDLGKKRGGDTGWFKDGELYTTFESIAKNNFHKVGDIITFEIPEKNAHYVVLKTHNTKTIKEAKVLKVTEPRGAR